MRLCSLASGSSGNSTYVGSESTHLLIDCGISRRRISQGLCRAQLDLGDISGILITHEHTDHISSLGVIERACHIPVYASEGTIRGILAEGKLGDFDRNCFYVIKANCPFEIGDITVKPFKVSHDANEPVCFRLENRGKSAGIVTDLGFYDAYLTDNFKGLDIILAEANHDIRMLESGKYPYYLKRRISGALGHLSNEASGRFISEILNDNVREIILAHLSRENNFPDLARLAVENEIDEAPGGYKRGDFKIEVARPDMPLDIVEV